ncbi:hypothetical protein SAMN05443507_1439 [Alicyclobacillus tolerans]|uniref:NTE family protein n=2 Tax=Alicyclobacillus tolerans TaxID=90970 RepID=A0A1M6Y695_9BACL|nr:hypothetical protein SAMN05443507_1439 [Alicyclobacillus montanus]
MTQLSLSPFESVEDFDRRVIRPVVEFIQSSPRGNIYRINPLRKNPQKFVELLDSQLYKEKSFADLVPNPEWTCYATSLNSALSWKFSQKEIGDSATGHTQPFPRDKVAFGVAASACFPPLFKPIEFSTVDRSFVFKYMEGQLVNRTNPSPPNRILLTDGGVYDNLGSESVITKGNEFIVSDASGITRHWRNDIPTFLSEVKRPVEISMDQIGKLRRRLLFERLMKSDRNVLVEAAKPISIYTSSENPQKVSPTPPDEMPTYPSFPVDFEKAIGEIRTDLNAFHDIEIQLLIWNGMVKVDAALKRWVPSIINKAHWNDVPQVKGIDVEEAMAILRAGREVKVWGRLHDKLHIDGRPRFVEQISELL